MRCRSQESNRSTSARRALALRRTKDFVLTSFSNLDLIDPLQRAIAHEGYDQPTPIQAQAIPLLLEGRDVLGCAQTGTGKTAAFALPILQHLAERPAPEGKRRIRVLVLSPTRELAGQIDERFGAYGRYLPFRHTVIFGGVNQRRQTDILDRGVDILVATPGRLLDLAGQGYVHLADVEFFVLDEADRMLDMGFIHDIRRVLGMMRHKRQNLLFSATMPRTIESLGAAFLQDPAWVDISPNAKTVDQITQRVMYVGHEDKRRLIADLLRSAETERSLVFTRTKHGANRLVKQLDRAGISAAAIHGNKSQAARRHALAGFRSGQIPVLVATDLAARGLDVEGISHVFNFDLPNEPETYVHRIGRTGRAGRDGIAISFCDETEGSYLRDIQKLIGFSVQVERDHPYHDATLELRPGVNPPPPPAAHFGRQGRGQPRGGTGYRSGQGTGRGTGRESERRWDSNDRPRRAQGQMGRGSRPGQESGRGPRADRSGRPDQGNSRGPGDDSRRENGRGPGGYGGDSRRENGRGPGGDNQRSNSRGPGGYGGDTRRENGRGPGGYGGDTRRSNSRGPSGDNQRSNSRGPSGDNQRSNSRGPGGDNQRSKSRGPGGDNQRSNSRGPGGDSQRSKSRGPGGYGGDSRRNNSRGPGGGNQRSNSRGPTGGNQRNNSRGPTGGNQRNNSRGPTGGNQRNSRRRSGGPNRSSAAR